MKRRFVFALALTACGGGLGTLGVIPDEDAGTKDAGREASSALDAGSDVLTIIDAAIDSTIEASPTRVSPEGGRPAAVACEDAGRPPGEPVTDAGGCAADTDCDGGVDGRCDYRHFLDGGTTNACSYNTCFTDTTCTGVCACGVGSTGQNLCLSNSNCRIDTDCTNGERCVFSDPPIFHHDGIGITVGNEIGLPNYSGDAIGYFCTTPQDDCSSPHPPLLEKCIYNANSKHWQWGGGP